MSTFAEFARYYDLFYGGKDYANEAAFVRSILERTAPDAKSILELGCGTARHAAHLVAAGYRVTGIDRSAEMLDGALATVAALPQSLRERLKLVHGDVTRLGPEVGVHDAVISLFHVVNYQTDNAALEAMFREARRAVATHGVFFFDFWYGPAVLTDPPVVRVREMSSEAGEKVIRIAEPVVDTRRNRVDVNYRLLVTAPDGSSLRESREQHPMRYLFLPEIEMLAQHAGFSLSATGRWMTEDELGPDSWLGWAVLKAI